MRQVKKGSVNVSVTVYIIDSTDGTPETGVVYNTSGIDLQYHREGAAAVAITEATLAALTTAHTDGGFLTIGFGAYRLDVPDAAFATGAETVDIFGTVTGMIVLPQTIQLVDFDPEDATRLGLTSLPNAAADAAGGLPISDAGGLDMDGKLANTNEITTARMAALTDWINGGRLDLILDIIAADVVNLDGSAMRGTNSAALASAYTAARAAFLDNIDGHTAQTGDNYARIGAPAGASVSADVAAVKAETALIVADTGTDGVVLANDAITAPKIASDAFGAAELSADAVSEIASAMMPQKNVAFSDITILMVDSTDHVTPKTGLTLTVTRSIDGAAFGSATGTAAEIANGIYQFDASQADMNGDMIIFRFAGTNADDAFLTIKTTP